LGFTLFPHSQTIERDICGVRDEQGRVGILQEDISAPRGHWAESAVHEKSGRWGLAEYQNALLRTHAGVWGSGGPCRYPWWHQWKFSAIWKDMRPRAFPWSVPKVDPHTSNGASSDPRKWTSCSGYRSPPRVSNQVAIEIAHTWVGTLAVQFPQFHHLLLLVLHIPDNDSHHPFCPMN